MRYSRWTGVAVGGLVVATFLGLQGCSDPGRAVAPTYEAVRVTRRDLSSSVIATGTVRPKVGAEVRVGSRVSGIVQRLYVNVGDRVEEGDLLAELDPTGLEARLRQARAAEANALAGLDLARQNEARVRRLFDDRIVPASDLDQAIATRKLAEASLEEAEANIEAARIERDYSTIHAPIGGVVASVSTQEGETVAASFAAPTFVTIIDLDRLEVWAWIDETDIGRIEVGQLAGFTVDTYPDTEFAGVVTAIQPAAEVRNNVVNYITRIEIVEIRERILRPEMTTTIEVFLSTREQVLTVPNAALRREQGRKYVWVEGDSGPRQQWVKTGWKDRDFIQIVEGLAEGDQVLVGDPSDDSLEL